MSTIEIVEIRQTSESITLEKYFISMTCKNYGDTVETVWRVILFIEILWQN